MRVKNTSPGIRGVPLRQEKGQPQEIVELRPGETKNLDLDTKNKVVQAWIESGDISVDTLKGTDADQAAEIQKAQDRMNAANEAHIAAEKALADAPTNKKAASALKEAEEELTAARAALDALQ